jgi:hypothetical protein
VCVECSFFLHSSSLCVELANGGVILGRAQCSYSFYRYLRKFWVELAFLFKFRAVSTTLIERFQVFLRRLHEVHATPGNYKKRQLTVDRIFSYYIEKIKFNYKTHFYSTKLHR